MAALPAAASAGYTVKAIRRGDESLADVRRRTGAKPRTQRRICARRVARQFGTLVCSVLPALMVALGAGAALAGPVGAVPRLAWLSEHKAAVFGVAAAMLGLAGAAIWRARRLPCPADPALARACRRLCGASAVLDSLALAAFFAGAVFAFALPRFG